MSMWAGTAASWLVASGRAEETWLITVGSPAVLMCLTQFLELCTWLSARSAPLSQHQASPQTCWCNQTGQAVARAGSFWRSLFRTRYTWCVSGCRNPYQNLVPHLKPKFSICIPHCYRSLFQKIYIYQGKHKGNIKLILSWQSDVVVNLFYFPPYLFRFCWWATNAR